MKDFKQKKNERNCIKFCKSFSHLQMQTSFACFLIIHSLHSMKSFKEEKFLLYFIFQLLSALFYWAFCKSLKYWQTTKLFLKTKIYFDYFVFQSTILPPNALTLFNFIHKSKTQFLLREKLKTNTRAYFKVKIFFRSRFCWFE